MAIVTTAAQRAEPTPKDITLYHRFLAEGKPGAHAYAVLLGLKTFDPSRLLKEVERGFPIANLERFRTNFQLDTPTIVRLLGMTQRTLARRKREGRLAPAESDRLLAVARLFARSLDLFEGDLDSAIRWLHRPQPSLGGSAPIEAAATELGTTEVERLIGRLEEGVFA